MDFVRPEFPFRQAKSRDAPVLNNFSSIPRYRCAAGSTYRLQSVFVAECGTRNGDQYAVAIVSR